MDENIVLNGKQENEFHSRFFPTPREVYNNSRDSGSRPRI